MRPAVRPGTPVASIDRRLSRPVNPGFGLPVPGVTDGSSGPVSVSVTPGASNTKGSWAQITGSLAQEITGMFIWVTTATHLSANNNGWLLDIGTGAAASETVVIPNVLAGAKEVGSLVAYPLLGYFPIRIPSGTRLAARLQANSATPSPSTGEFRFQFTYEPMLGAYPSDRPLIDLGANTSTSRGIDLAALGATNTKGSWTQVVAFCPSPLQGLIVCVQGGTDTSFTAGWAVLDVGVGAGGSESVILGDLPMRFNSNEAVGMLWPGFWPCSIKAADRIAVRYACSTTANDLDVNLIGVPS